MKSILSIVIEILFCVFGYLSFYIFENLVDNVSLYVLFIIIIFQTVWSSTVLLLLFQLFYRINFNQFAIVELSKNLLIVILVVKFVMNEKNCTYYILVIL